MEYHLKITPLIFEKIEAAYRITKSECVIALYGSRVDSTIRITKMQLIESNDYRVSNYKHVTVKAETILKIIANGVLDGYDIFILLHNHPSFIPFFSCDDKKTIKMIRDFIIKNNIKILSGIGALSGKRIGFIIPDCKIRDIKFKKCRYYMELEDVCGC